MNLTVYLAGQIHDNWRDEVKQKAEKMNLPITFVNPMTNHGRSDDIGEEILGEQPNKIFKDDKASDFNNLRTEILLSKSDVVLAFFGESYKQWNTAMDASTALALNKPLVLVRDASLHHALKELSNKATATVENFDQALQALSYVFEEE
ncbi:YtoQ family protein [Pseudalkalibacillus salsuginis]|uniref:YtoQ family protein n=1 Tax=Pseudalkalibacillus salsuginis TaxID=2910972 RepID=UPI001F1D5293|nr:YtoQ family protein [Pseudalkalibacillus salsuginis]MCF6408825.1 YtoQ family protein [Pseudalkalibacillus salsuginis]